MIIDISPEAEAILETKARVLGASVMDVLNAMILEFAPSTKEEITECARKRDEERDTFIRGNDLMLNSLSTHFRCWTNGYKTGWRHFQTRKKNLYDLRGTEETHG